MEILTVNATLLNHLFYQTEITGGTIGGSKTGPFLGDLALNFALKRSLSRETYWAQTVSPQPAYGRIREFGFYATVGRPLSYQVTVPYTQNTLFHADGFYDKETEQKSRGHTFKTVRRAQGIEAGAVFQTCIVSQEPLKLPTTLRIGTRRETLVELTAVKERPEICWLNAFSARSIFQNLNPILEGVQKRGIFDMEYRLENYYLIKSVPLSVLESVFSPIFP